MTKPWKNWPTKFETGQSCNLGGWSKKLSRNRVAIESQKISKGTVAAPLIAMQPPVRRAYQNASKKLQTKSPVSPKTKDGGDPSFSETREGDHPSFFTPYFVTRFF